MAGTTALVVGGLALAAVGTGVQFVQQRKAQKEQEKAAEAAERRQELEARRQRRQVLREQRIARAQLQNIAAQTGAQGGSGELGGTSSLASQAGFNLGFINQTRALGSEITQRNINASRAQSRAAIGGAVAGIGGQMASFGISQGGRGPGRAGGGRSSGVRTGFGAGSTMPTGSAFRFG